MGAAPRPEALAVSSLPCLLVLALALLQLPGCGKSDVHIGVGAGVNASVTSATVNTSSTVDITAIVTGTSNKSVVWSVCDGNGANCVTGGNAVRGTIVQIGTDSQGNSIARYTAPASVPVPPDCRAETGGCSVVVQGFLVAFEVSCFTRVTVEPGTNPIPVITSLVPPSAIVGGPGFTLTVNGSGFVPSSVVRWEGSDRTTTFINSIQLQAAIPAGDIAATGTAQVTVFNPPPDGGLSNAVAFAINNPVPIITSLNPPSTLVGGPSFTLDVMGTGFIASSVVQWNGANRTTTFMSATLLQASIPDTDIAATGTANVTVFNLGPGGGTSNMELFTINNPVPILTMLTPSSTAAGGAAFTLTVDGSGFIPSTFGPGSVVQWNGSSRTTMFVNSTQVTADIPASDIAATGTAMVTVVNPAPGGGTSNALTFTINPAIMCTPSVLERVSLTNGGGEGNGTSGVRAPTSSGARFAAFVSGSDNLVTGDTNSFGDIFVRDTCRGGPLGCTPSTVRVSVASDGTQSSTGPFNITTRPAISADGRFVAFESDAPNLVTGDTNATFDVFLHDRDTDNDGTFDEAGQISTTRVSVSTAGAEGTLGFPSSFPAITPDGRFVVFRHDSGALVPGDTNGFFDVFVRDTCFGAPMGCTVSTVRVSVAGDGTQGNASGMFQSAISSDGRYVAFSSAASTLVPGDTNSFTDIFVHDRDADEDGLFDETGAGERATARVSVDSNGAQANGISSSNEFLAMSADGRFVAFQSGASNLVTGDTNAANDIFVHDRDADEDGIFDETGAGERLTIRASVTTGGAQGNGASADPTMSADGRFVSFNSGANNLVTGDTNGAVDAFVRDTCLGAVGCTPATVRISVDAGGAEGNGGIGNSDDPVISPDGSFVTFTSSATNLITGDTNALDDVFLAQSCFGTGGGGGGNPVPVIDNLMPSSAIVGGPAFTLTVNGSNFISSSVVRWEGSDRTTTFISDTVLEAAILDTDIAATGTANVTVFNPGPVGGTSNMAVFNINNPAPALTLLTPSSTAAGGLAFTLTVDGSGFIADSEVQWDGSPRTTTFVNSTQVTADIPATDIAATGTAMVTVVNPAPGGGTSNPLTFAISSATCSAEVLERVSVDTAGTQANGSSHQVNFLPGISNGGRFVAFQSDASNLVAGDTNGFTDVFVRDTCRGAPMGCTPSTVRVSVASGGAEGNQQSLSPHLSADGRFVVFFSRASNLVPSDTNGVVGDVFLHDRDTDNDGIFDEPGFISTALVSVSTAGVQSTSVEVSSATWNISANGRFVVFASVAQEYTGDSDGFSDVFVRDTCFGAPMGCTPSTVKVSVDSNGVAGNSNSPFIADDTISLSGSGRFVAFSSAANNLVTMDMNGLPDVFLHDRDTDNDGIFDEAGFISTTRVSLAFDGSEAGMDVTGQGAHRPFVSANGRAVAFTSRSSNLVPTDTVLIDVFVRDTCLGAGGGCTPTTLLGTIDPMGMQTGGFTASLSADGRFLAFRQSIGFQAVVRDTCIGATGCTPSSVIVSQTPGGMLADNPTFGLILSLDASAVAFASSALNLDPADTNLVTDVFLAQTCFSGSPFFLPGVFAAVTGGGNGISIESSASATGRFVAFASVATNLVVPDTNNTSDILVYDSCVGAPMGCTPSIVRVSVKSDGSEANANQGAREPAISATGRFVAFDSDHTNLVPNDLNGVRDIFVHDRDADNDGLFDEAGFIATVRVSVASDGTEAMNGNSFHPAISPDGRFVGFSSVADNLVSADTNGAQDVFVHDRDADENGTFDETCMGCRKTVRVSVAGDGTQGNHVSGDFAPSVSADGRFVAFLSRANNLVAGDIDTFNAIFKVFVHDRDADNDGLFDETGMGERATVMVSRSSSGVQGTDTSANVVMSADGRFVAFSSAAQNLVVGTSAASDIFVHDRDADNDGIFDETGAGERATVLVSLAGDGTPSNQGGQRPSISADGRFVAFQSQGDNLVPGDSVLTLDVFVHDRDADNDGLFDETGVGERVTIRVSVLPDGTEANDFSRLPSLSADGRFVSFESAATNFTVPADMFSFVDIFLAATGIP